MKIKLIVATSEGKYPDLRVGHQLAADFHEANKIKKNSIDWKTYSFIRALELNSEFTELISKLRKEFSIPDDGYELNEWNKLKKSKVAGNEYGKWRIELNRKSISIINDNFRIIPRLENNLQYIVAINSIFIPLNNISLDIPYTVQSTPSRMAPKILINSDINSPRQLKSFIDENWRELKQALTPLSALEVNIAPRDFEIIRLKELGKLTNREIADRLDLQYNQPTLDETSVKIAYSRARKKINSITK